MNVRLPRVGSRDPAVLSAAALLTAMLIWGATYVVTKDALEDVGPFALLGFRFGVAFLFLLPFAIRRGFRFGTVLQPRFLAFGLTGIVLHMGFETVGLQFTTAANAALIVGAIPALAAGLSVLLLGERVTGLRASGIGLSLLGVGLVAGAPVVGADPQRWIGDVLMLGAALAWAVYTIQGKRLGGSHDALASTTASIGSALMILVPAAALETAVSGAPSMHASSVGAVLYLGFGASAAAFLLWNHALRHLDASVAAPFVNLVPVFGVGFAVLAGEEMSIQQLLGGAVVGAGVLLSTRRPRRGRVEPARPAFELNAGR